MRGWWPHEVVGSHHRLIAFILLPGNITWRFDREEANQREAGEDRQKIEAGSGVEHGSVRAAEARGRRRAG